MKLHRQKLIDFEQQWLSQHPNAKDNPQEYMSFLEGIGDIISEHDFEDDDRFVTYGRRDFLRKEFSEYLNDEKASGRGKYNDAFVDLAEFYTGNTHIYRSFVPEGENFLKIDKDDSDYRKEGIICKQEIDIINEMIDEFVAKLVMSNFDNVDYPVPESLKDYIYIQNGNIYAKQKLPKDLEVEYENFKKRLFSK